MSISQQKLRDALVAIVSDEHVITDSKSLDTYSQDKSPFAPVKPNVVVRPSCAEEIASLLQLATELRIPVVTRGGGFSLTGYLLTEDSILIDTRRMNRVVEIDPVNMTVTAECGIIMQDLHTQVASAGFYVHTVGIPIGYTTLGGVLSGVQGGGYPSTLCVSGNDLHYLLGLRVALADGTLVDTNAGGANIHRATDFVRGGNAPDVTGLFVGDGGSFGIKVQATLQIFPRPPERAAGCWDFDEFSDLWQAIVQLTALPTLPYETITVLQSTPLSLFHFSRGDDQAAATRAATTIDEICATCGGVMAPEEMRQHALEIGEAEPDYQDIFINVDRGLLAFVTGKKEFPGIYMHVKQALEEQIESRRLDELGLSLMIYFSPLQRNSMYVTMSILFDADTPGSRQAALDLQKSGYELVVELGACPEPHQGFASLANAAGWSPEFRRLMVGMKKTFDPNGLLNPGVWGL